ncbi:UNVERIFIED_CONTAM: hypothetical protein RMT77_014174 [Armadillidium vulgare]
MQSCKKLFLGSLKFSSEERLRVIYRNEDIEKVDIIGSVVSLLQKEKCLIFKLDDMTGIVECVQFKNENLDLDNESSNSCGENKNFLETLEPEKELKLGDIVNVRGKVKVYKCKLQITCNNVRIISDPNEIIFRVKEIKSIENYFSKKQN